MAVESICTEIEKVMGEVKLPEGIKWLDSDVGRCMVRQGPGVVFFANFVSWLVKIEKKPDYKIFAHRVEIGPIPRRDLKDPEWRESFKEHLRTQIHIFVLLLSVGKAIEIEDGAELP